jgi:acetyl-CoA synthetase
MPPAVVTQPVAWRPPDRSFATAPVGRFAARHGIADWDALAHRAAEDPRWFWEAAVADIGVPWMTPYRTVLDLSDGIEFPHFFAGGRLNACDAAVDRHVREGRGAARALHGEGDGGEIDTLSFAELQERVGRAAGALRALGVRRGDAVALMLPMIPEAVVTVLAAARIGAVLAPMFSGFGPHAVRLRLQDSGAQVLVTCDSFPRRGRPVQLKTLIDEAVAGLEAPAHVVVVRRGGGDCPMQPGRDVWWDEVLAAAPTLPDAEPMDAEDALLYMYTSGSTGRPKACVHTHAGLPIKVAQESRHNLGIDETACTLWVTDFGWVMGVYVTYGTLLNGGTVALYEGTPDWPGPERLWQAVEKADATVLGVSPTLVRSLMAHGDGPLAAHPMHTLRAIGSTGEPWNTDPWLWCLHSVGRGRVPIVNISGGTECGGALVGGATCVPAKPGSFYGPCLGVVADVVDADGQSVRDAVGELVVRAPWPGMTRGFRDGTEHYLDTYWRSFPGMWRQGDFAVVDEDGFWFLLGRSDDTIMVAGKRVGPAEVESLLVGDDEVVEAAAIGVRDGLKGEALVCLVTVRNRAARDETALETRLSALVTAALGRPMRPRAVHIVDALPKTRNGKVLRRVARAVYTGDDPGDLSALEDAAVLERLPRDGGGTGH